MAKRGTLEHPKTVALAIELDIEPWAALGLLEALWHWTAKFCQRGDIGAHNPRIVCMAIHYAGDAAKCFAALRAAGWLDGEGSAAYWHDWSEHADNAVHLHLKRKGLTFADGALPYTRNRAKDESETGGNATKSEHGRDDATTMSRQGRDTGATKSQQSRKSVTSRTRAHTHVPAQAPAHAPTQAQPVASSQLPATTLSATTSVVAFPISPDAAAPPVEDGAAAGEEAKKAKKFPDEAGYNALIDAWNTLPDGFAPRVRERDNDDLRALWVRSQKVPKLRKLLSDPAAIIAKMKNSGETMFAANWVRFAWLFTRGRSGEVGVVKLMDDAYIDKPRPSSGSAPGGKQWKMPTSKPGESRP